MRNPRRRALAITTLMALGMTCAHAETISYADAATKLAADCGADIKKLCKGLNLGNNRIGECLRAKSVQVSPVCLSSLATVSASIQQREQAQSAYGNICKHDMAQRCKGVKGDGYILACLIKAERRVGAQCNQAITNAGWR